MWRFPCASTYVLNVLEFPRRSPGLVLVGRWGDRLTENNSGYQYGDIRSSLDTWLLGGSFNPSGTCELILLDSCGALTGPRSHKSQDSNLNLDLSEEDSGRLCAAHSCAVWGGTGFSSIRLGIRTTDLVLGVPAGRGVYLCVVTVVMESPELHPATLLFRQLRGVACEPEVVLYLIRQGGRWCLEPGIWLTSSESPGPRGGWAW